MFEPWVAALDGITEFEHLEVLYWLHLSRRDLVRQSPRNDGVARGTFSLRTPVRPNPIGTQLVRLMRVEGGSVFVRGLDCLDGTPLIDLKPDRCAFTPLAPRQPGDDQVGRPSVTDARPPPRPRRSGSCRLPDPWASAGCPGIRRGRPTGRHP